jgi:ATP-dependent helicase HepA
MLEAEVAAALGQNGMRTAWELADELTERLGRRVTMPDVSQVLQGNSKLFRRHGSGTQWSLRASPPVPVSPGTSPVAPDGVTPCPLCGGPTTARVATRGPRAGQTFLGCARFPSCKGSLSLGEPGRAPAPAAESANATARATEASDAVPARAARKVQPSSTGTAGPGKKMRPGDLVVSSANGLGVGKAVAQSGPDQIVVEYFDNPGEDRASRTRESVPRASLRRFQVNNETRVFWQRNGQWTSGRVLYTTRERDILVKAHEWEGFVEEKELYVRWERPLADAVGFGAAGLLESPLLADLRRPFLQEVLKQRAAAHGMSGVLSSAVEMHEHQVEVARRVLEDPVQRYLLADEVGLGKTVEAGMILRQMMIDEGDLTVQLVLPPFLVSQWRRELGSKFHISDFPRVEIRFGRDDRPEEWEPADVVVVDEAHNLARLSESEQSPLRRRYERLTKIALASPRLLLLSATPVLHNEHVLLAMLRLLDPQVYGTSGLSDLQERVASRATLGRALLGMNATLPAVLLRNRFDEIERLFSDDEDVRSALVVARAASAAGDKPALERAIQRLRIHLSEVYRLHRRMLRTRRTHALGQTFRVGGRRPPRVAEREADVAGKLDRLLEDWREELLATAEATQDFDGAARLLGEAVTLSADPARLSLLARGRAEAVAPETERDALRRLAEGAAAQTATAAQVADLLSYEVGGAEKAVVFCPSTAMVAEVAQALADLLGPDQVATHVTGADADETERAVRAFEQPGGRVQVLVSDSSGEEGRNFQFADVLVHVGLPSDAARLEQRIGRLDRWIQDQRVGQWRSVLLGDPGRLGTLASAWYSVLLHGFRIFDDSVASLQHAVEAAGLEAWTILLKSGSAGAGHASALVRERLAAELEQVREQDALDSIEAVADERAVYEAVRAVEQREEAFAAGADDLLAERGEAGNLRFQRVGDPRRGVGRYDVRGRDSHGQALLPLVPTWRIIREFAPQQEQPGTFLRSVAVARPGVRLYRYGAPFVDAVADFLWHDDRGRAFGMWRWDPTWTRAEQIAYRFDFHVEADVSVETTLARQDIDAQALQRRADAVMPPLITTLWLDAQGEPIEDAELLRVLERRYRKPRGAEDPSGGDYSLNSKRILHVYDLIPENEWAARWRRAEERAEARIREFDDVVSARRAGIDRAHAAVTTRAQQLRLRVNRAARDEAQALEKEILLEEQLASALGRAVQEPRLRLDSTGVLVVSGAPFETVQV